jgi:hypothetical protein
LTDIRTATTKEVRDFGILFGILGGVAAAWMAWRGSGLWPIPLLVGSGFLLGGVAVPAMLRPLHAAWMALARVLAWVNTRLLLGIFFYCIMTPVAFVMRVGGWDPLGKVFDKRAGSYWVKRTSGPTDPTRCEHLF